MIASKERKIQI